MARPVSRPAARGLTRGAWDCSPRIPSRIIRRATCARRRYDYRFTDAERRQRSLVAPQSRPLRLVGAAAKVIGPVHPESFHGPDSAQTPKRSAPPGEAELAGRRHVAGERRGGDDGGAREVAFAAEAHAVLPVAVERRDRALALASSASGPWPKQGPHQDWRISPPTPTEDLRRSTRRRAADPGFSICRPTPPEPGKIVNVRATLRKPVLARRAEHERGREQVVVAAVGARADHRLVEGQPLARDLLGGKRVAGRERLGDHRRDLRRARASRRSRRRRRRPARSRG